MNTQLKHPPPVRPLSQDPRFEVYSGGKKLPLLIQDAMAGLIVALVAIPLGVGFAMASGLGPEKGIIAGAIAGILGGLFGGSKYQVYGPTAAFIPLISSIVMLHGTSFLITSTVIAGVIIILMGLFKLGDLFSKIPFSVTVGFTVGIAMCIGLGELPDALGSLSPMAHPIFEKLQQVSVLLMHPNPFTLALAILTFIIIKFCYKTSVLIPGPLIAIVFAVVLSQTVLHGHDIFMIAHKFGKMDENIFKLTLPVLGTASWSTYIKPVISIVFIASLESLLSARMADRLAENCTPFNSNQELIGQGFVNIIVPLINGFPCTGAFARTATSIKAGASSPAASVFQGSFMLILMLFFSRYVSLIPMACIAGLLMYVATNMVKSQEVRHVLAQGKFHLFLMVYTALVTFFTDLFIAVSTATAIYYVFQLLRQIPFLRINQQ